VSICKCCSLLFSIDVHSLFRSIFQDVLSEKPLSDEASTIGSKGTPHSSLATLDTVNASVINRLKELCEEMNAPKGFLQIVGHHLLGDTKGKMLKVEKAAELDDIIAFMAQVFIRSTAHADMIIMALDDVHWMDNLSWKVVQCIFETSQNILIVIGSRPLASHSLSVDDEFWECLTGEYKEKKLYTEIRLGPLNEIDVREMAAITLSCEPEDLSDDFCDDVFVHSGGMPYFASEILENCVRKKQCERLENGKMGWLAGEDQVSCFPIHLLNCDCDFVTNCRMFAIQSES